MWRYKGYAILLLLLLLLCYRAECANSTCRPVPAPCSQFYSHTGVQGNLTELLTSLNAQITQFNWSLQQYDCQDSNRPTFYSPVRNCNSCLLAFQKWSCQLALSKCNNVTSSTSPQVVKPCRQVCWDVIESCPSFLGFDCPDGGDLVEATYDLCSGHGRMEISYLIILACILLLLLY
jgi:hypothetical protein